MPRDDDGSFQGSTWHHCDDCAVKEKMREARDLAGIRGFDSNWLPVWNIQPGSEEHITMDILFNTLAKIYQ